MELSRLVKVAFSVIICLCILFTLASCGGKTEDEAKIDEKYEVVSEIVLPNIDI